MKLPEPHLGEKILSQLKFIFGASNQVRAHNSIQEHRGSVLRATHAYQAEGSNQIPANAKKNMGAMELVHVSSLFRGIDSHKKAN